jgi:hypothetical protein
VRKVRVKEGAWPARVAAKKLGYSQVAMVIGRTIYLHNTPVDIFRNSKKWVIHELKHVEQYERYGFFRFLWLYFREYMKNGYHQNKFEVEARQAETDDSLLAKYHIEWTKG